VPVLQLREKNIWQWKANHSRQEVPDFADSRTRCSNRRRSRSVHYCPDRLSTFRRGGKTSRCSTGRQLRNCSLLHNTQRMCCASRYCIRTVSSTGRCSRRRSWVGSTACTFLRCCRHRGRSSRCFCRIFLPLHCSRWNLLDLHAPHDAEAPLCSQAHLQLKAFLSRPRRCRTPRQSSSHTPLRSKC